MMRAIFGIVLLMGLGLAGYAVLVAKKEFTKYQVALQRQQEAIVPVKEVYVASKQLAYGAKLQKTDVKSIAWPADSVPSGAFTSMDQIFPPGRDELRTVLRVMERDEPLLIVKLTAPGESAGIAASLGEGMRAFTLSINALSGVSGFLRPGDRVDVYWTGSNGDGGFTKLIHPNLKLLALDQDTDTQNGRPMLARSVTVEATTAVVAKLAQAQATGQLTMALVGIADENAADAVSADIDAVLGAAGPVAEDRVCTIRTRKGAEVVLIPIPCS